MKPKIVYCVMAMNRLSEVKHCLDLVGPFVDDMVVIDGGSLDESFFYLRNRKDVNVFLHPWTDNFSAQRNNYIMRAREVAGTDNFYCLVSDPDEWFQKSTLENLRSVVDFCEQQNANMAQFQCRSATLEGDERVWESLDDYWKGLMFKYEPGIKYVGNPHETLVPPSGLRVVRTPFLYEHIKQSNIIWLRGMRNYIAGGGGKNYGEKNAHWVKLREIMSELGLNSWHEFEKYVMVGNIDQRIKDEFINYLSLTEAVPGDADGLSEMRESYKVYFRIYHPEEEPENLKGVNIP